MSRNNLVENFSKMVDHEDRANEKLHLVHTDICRPMKTSLLNGSMYFVLFIHDYSRFCWVYFMKHKFEVANIFFKFKAMVENQTTCKLKMIRSNNGTKYTSERFLVFCEDARIHHQLSKVYTP
ncbi:pleiotropic drug resistance protein 3-like [Gossypium australe]|uniref:Pleiotropic drug resistance protein 3-like n=1 Tax=Gossypium australe TaxID=47621 RepID=A0A5B6VM34_9ROSI|nr:pleiotropic drug resistance protein 3-like [Gossypium australe]